MNERSGARTLIFVIHGLRGSRKNLADLENLLEVTFPGCVLKIPDLPHRALLSSARAPAIVRDIIRQIDDAYKEGAFDRVLLIGHSMGAVMARRVLVEASGVPAAWGPEASGVSKLEADLQGIEERPWASKVDRLIMFASISRGWSVLHAKSPLQSFQWNVGGMLGHILPKRRRPTLFDFRMGSPFIVQTRLRWLEYCRHRKRNRPQVVQFLGTRDDVAPPNDSVDFATTETSDEFIQVELPHSNHANLLRFYPGHRTGPSEAAHMKKRHEIVRGLLLNNAAAYEDQLVKREWFLDELPSPPDPSIKHVVFVLHGIRDRGFWTKKIAARIREKADVAGIRFMSRTPSYGYFPILPFLLPWYRRQKVEWFMDHYVEAAAVYPKADMHFLGHSNGTYLAARALQDYPIISFQRIFFAGSVVRRNYEWQSLVDAGRVRKIFNVVATADWVVAIFPNGLRPLQCVFDLGGAGHVGFETPVPDALYQMDHPAPAASARDYVKGGHSAGREENLWNQIADFFVHEHEIPAGKSEHFKPYQPVFWRVIGFVSPAIVAAIATLIIGVGLVSLWAAASRFGLLAPPDWAASGWFWPSWFGLSAAGQILVLGFYAAFLRFMALRF